MTTGGNSEEAVAPCSVWLRKADSRCSVWLRDGSQFDRCTFRNKTATEADPACTMVAKMPVPWWHRCNTMEANYAFTMVAAMLARLYHGA